MNEILLKQLNILKYDNERQQVYESLAFLGLKYYFSLYPQDQYLNLGELYSLAERTLKEWNSPAPRLPNQRTSSYNPVGSAKSNQQLQQQLQQQQQSQNHYGSKYRPEALSHFPFVDEAGTVYDIFHGTGERKPNLFAMGLPGRKKLILKVFDSMRFDRNGIRLSDLPEALQMVGIDVPEKLKRLLERTRSKNLNGPLKDIDDDEESEAQPLEYAEKYITLTQWKQVIRNFLSLQKFGKEFSSIDDMFSSNISRQKQNTGAFKGGRTGEDEDDDDIENDSMEEIPNEEMKSYQQQRNESGRFHQANQQQYREEEQFDERRQSFKGHQNAQPLRQKGSSYYSKLKNVKSRIGDVIQQDKQHFYREQNKTDTAALSTIAKQRMQDITSRPKPPSLRDPEFFSSSRATTVRANSNIFRNTEDHQNRKRYTPPKAVSRLKDLSSGTAALQIADSFLNSRVGRELTANNEREFLPEDISAKAAEVHAMKLLGLKHENSNDVRDGESDQSERAQRSLELEQLRERKANHFDKSTAILTGDQTHDYRQQYMTGWKASNGGWVADFGPPHTRSFYTGPERARASLHEKKEPYVMDEMLFAIAKDIHGANQNPLDNSETTTSSSNLADQLQVGQAKKSSEAPASKALTDFSDSSLDPSFMATGAGVKGIIDGADLSDDSTDQLLGKLSDSVALKNITSKKENNDHEVTVSD